MNVTQILVGTKREGHHDGVFGHKEAIETIVEVGVTVEVDGHVAALSNYTVSDDRYCINVED